MAEYQEGRSETREGNRMDGVRSGKEQRQGRSESLYSSLESFFIIYFGASPVVPQRRRLSV